MYKLLSLLGVLAVANACSTASKNAWCRKHTDKEGSYCKVYQDVEVCQYSDLTCGCLPANCDDVCNDTPACAKSAQNTYCKYWDGRDVCFGLYWKDDRHSSACYAPEDPTCDTTGKPVECFNV